MNARAERYIAAALLVVTVVLFGVLEVRGGCPLDFGAQRVELPAEGGTLVVDGVRYSVGASALLDYMPHGYTTAWERAAVTLRGVPHPLVVVATVASSRETLGDARFTCVRATRGTDVWLARPSSYGTQTSIDGYPPGAPSPATIEAWRLATATGPEWTDGDEVKVELSLAVRGKHYIVALPPISLMRGG